MAKPRPKRVHPSGRLTFRNNVRGPKAKDLPYRIAEDEALCWDELVPSTAGEVEIEIGCGKGSFLVAAADRRPGTFLLGVEAGPAYAEYCADRARRQGLANVFLVADDARLFLADTVPQGRIRRVHIYYPDPWPKWRHRKRRIFSAELPPLLHRVLEPGGELLVATDNLRYFGEILAVLGETPLLARAFDLEHDYGAEDPGLAFGPTNFSRKYQIEGRTLRTCAWRRVATERDET